MAGLHELGWEVDDVTAYRTVRAAPPPAPIRDAIKTGKFDAVVFTSSSTVRNLVGIAGKPHAVDDHRGDRPGHREDVRGARPARRRPGPEAVGRGAGRRARRLRGRPAARDDRGRGSRDQAIGAAYREPPSCHLSRASRDLLRRWPDLSGGPAAAAAHDAGRCAGWSARPRCCRASLVLPMFVAEAAADPRPIASMPGVVQHTRDSLRKAAVEAVEAGVGGLMLFGVRRLSTRTPSARQGPTRTAC